jgi:hypothetical protein
MEENRGYEELDISLVKTGISLREAIRSDNICLLVGWIGCNNFAIFILVERSFTVDPLCSGGDILHNRSGSNQKKPDYNQI